MEIVQFNCFLKCEDFRKDIQIEDCENLTLFIACYGCSLHGVYNFKKEPDAAFP